jgi:hypothetical protein
MEVRYSSRAGHLALTLAVFLLMPVFVVGQEANPAVQPRQRHQFQRPTLDERVQRLAKALDLNEAQQAGVRRLLERQQKEVARLRTDQTPGLDPAGRFRAINQNTIDQIRALLNDEQKKKYGLAGPLQRQDTSPGSSVEDWLNLTRPKPKSN